MLGVETAPTLEGPPAFLNSDLFDADDDSDEEVVRISKPKKNKATKALRLVLSDDEDEESDKEAPGLPLINGGESSGGTEISSGTQANGGKEAKHSPVVPDSEEDSDNDTCKGTQDEDRKKQRERSSGDESSSSGDSDDDGGSDEEVEEEEEEIAFQLSPIAPDPDQTDSGGGRPSRRVKKTDLQQIHSETQRIVRESSIRIPYHHPKPLSLDELFNKKPSPAALRPIRGKVPRFSASQQNSLKCDTSLKESAKDIDELPDVLSSQITQGKNESSKQTSDINMDALAIQTREEDKQLDESEGKDGAIIGESGCHGEALEDIRPMETDESATTVNKETKMEEPSSTETDVSSTVLIPAGCSPPGSSSKAESESEKTPKPSNTSDKDLAASTQIPSTQTLPQHSPKDVAEKNLSKEPTFKTPSPAPAKQIPGESLQARRMRLLQESLTKLKGVKPRLSGSPRATIDLDEGAEPSQEQKGMAKLMKRFAVHTRHVKPVKQKDVQVNIVTKEKGVDGKDDLKHHSFTVGLEGKPEELDPALNVPGAKLTKLKENLQTGIRARRQEERQKRVQAFRLDNEEGFGDGEDEDEAELTEGSETGGEEEDEEDNDADDGAGLDEDDDADYEPGNEFVDDEAESDDDDVEEEEGGHYGEDEEDDDEVLVTSSKKKISKPSKKSSQKSKPGREHTVDSDDDEISPSRRRSSKKRAMVVDDEEDDYGAVDKGLTLRLNSVETDDTDAELTDGLQDSGRFIPGLTHRPLSALDQSSKTMEMFDSATNSTVISDFQVPIIKGDSSTKKVSWSGGKDTDSSKDSTGFALPAPARQDSNSNSLDTSFEMMTSLIPAHQPEGGMRSGRASADSVKESFTPFSKHQSLLGSLSTKTTPEVELTMPVEDSQDLFRDDSPTLPTIADTETVGESQSFHFSFEDETQTQFFDENGLLNLKPSSSKSQSKPKPLFGGTQGKNMEESQGGMDELLGLCSGKFTETQAGKDEEEGASKPRPFSQVSEKLGTQATMEELLDLCSGTFTDPNAKSQITSTRKMDYKDDDDKDDDGSNTSFHIMSDPDAPESDDDNDMEKHFSDDGDDDSEIGFRKKRRKDVDDEEEGEEEEEGVNDGEDLEDSDLDSEFAFDVNRKAFKGKTYGKKMNLANFVEDEAELSGSERDSDEDYDAEDEVDGDIEGIVNEEMGDQEELRNQVNKVHMKMVDDEEARRLRLYKEMYLPDGDLHSDHKRTRRFRWRNIDSQMDMLRPDSDGEENEEDAQQDQDTQWRLQRYEREQWLKENEGKEKGVEIVPEEIIAVEENSQFAKCLRTASFKKTRAESCTPTLEVEEKKEKEKEKKVSTPKPLKIMTKRGSFLNRSKNDLAKMASMLKPIANPQGPRNNRNFVFQSAESSQSAMNEDSIMASEPPKVKRSASVSGPASTPSPAGPKAKRPRLERSQSTFTTNSVFRHF